MHTNSGAGTHLLAFVLGIFILVLGLGKDNVEAMLAEPPECEKVVSLTENNPPYLWVGAVICGKGEPVTDPFLPGETEALAACLERNGVPFNLERLAGWRYYLDVEDIIIYPQDGGYVTLGFTNQLDREVYVRGRFGNPYVWVDDKRETLLHEAVHIVTDAGQLQHGVWGDDRIIDDCAFQAAGAV